MPPISPDQVRSITNAARDLLQEAGELTSGRDPNYIRDADPGNIVDKVALAAARQGCRRYAADPGNPTAARRARVERACRPYLDSLDKPPGPSIELPFRGGQCDGVCYQIGVTNNSGSNEVIQARGPIGGVRGVTISGGGRLEIFARSEVNFSNSVSCLPLQAPGWVFGGLGGTAWDESSNPRITSLTRTDGGSDVCGNPPPDYTDPEPDPDPDPPGPITFNPEPGIDIDIDVTINPDVSIDIDIGTGPITIDPFAEPDPDGGGGGDGGDPGDPTDPGSPGGSEGTGSGGDAEGQAPEGQEIVGLLVTVDEAPGDANRFDNNSKQPYRGIGYIRMGYPGRLGLDITGGTVISPQFFHAPQRGLTNWAVAANIGFDLTIVPYYRSIEE